MNEIETFYGLVENTLDALRIFQMCQEGRLNRVLRRLHERERRLIRSGSVFVFDEEESGIRRWTDGRLWSPSRILGNFLIYRELEKKGSRVSKVDVNTATLPAKRKRNDDVNASPAGPPPPILPKASFDPAWWTVPRSEQSEDMAAIQEWLLSGSQGINPRHLQQGPNPNKSSSNQNKSDDQMVSADPMSGESLQVLKSKKLSNNHKGRYEFKKDGLIKKTISIQLDGHTHHLVAYYSLEDFCRGHLKLSKMLASPPKEEAELAEPNEQVPFEPRLMEMLRQVPIPVNLMMKQNFRKPPVYLASATANAQNILSGNPEDGEKLITALEYGAINPNDLNGGHGVGDQNRDLAASQFVPGGGIIFSSSTFPQLTSATNNSGVYSPRPRRHSSFLPATPSTSEPNSLDLLDESSSLSGEALEFLSQYSPQGNGNEDILSSLNEGEEEPENLETELFGTIFAQCKDYDNNNNNANNSDGSDSLTQQQPAIRGDDVLLTEFPV